MNRHAFESFLRQHVETYLATARTGADAAVLRRELDTLVTELAGDVGPHQALAISREVMPRLLAELTLARTIGSA